MTRALSIDDLPPHLQASARAQLAAQQVSRTVTAPEAPALRVHGVAIGPESPLRPATARARPRDLEGPAQARVIAWANAHTDRWPELARLFHVPNGGHRHPATAARLKAQGVKAGVPDLWLPARRVLDGDLKCGLVIEMKAPKGRTTPAQTDWLDYLEGAGWSTTVAYSADEAIAKLKAYLSAPENGDNYH